MRVLGLVAALSLTFTAITAKADDFYAGKQIRIIVGTGTGGGYDTYARLVARHLGNHIPGKPTLIVENMPGASGIKAVNHLYSAVPKDGTVISTFNNAIPFYQVTKQPGISFKSEELSWIGSLTQTATIVTVTNRAGVKTIEDAKNKQVIMGASGASGSKVAYPTMLNNVLGTKFKIVSGYSNSKPIMLAMERDEVQGDGGNPWSTWVSAKPDWVKDGTLVPLVQIGLRKEPDLPNVPLLTDLAKNDTDRAIFALNCAPVAIQQPFAGPPGVPKDRLEILRRAFEGMLKDSAFLEEVKNLRLDLSPLPGAEVARIVQSIINTPPQILDLAQAALLPPGTKAGGAQNEN